MVKERVMKRAGAKDKTIFQEKNLGHNSYCVSTTTPLRRGEQSHHVKC